MVYWNAKKNRYEAKVQINNKATRKNFKVNDDLTKEQAKDAAEEWVQEMRDSRTKTTTTPNLDADLNEIKELIETLNKKYSELVEKLK